MKTILLIEDDPTISLIYQTQFQKAGFQVVTADTGEAGLFALNTSRPNLVILDLMLPKTNGVEILKRIRADVDLASLPVFVLTAVSSSDLAKQAQQAGANRVFSKARNIPLDILDAIDEDGIFNVAPQILPPTACSVTVK